MDWVCTVCGKPTNQYTAVKANLHRDCETLAPAPALDCTAMALDMQRDNDRKQARLFGYSR